MRFRKANAVLGTSLLVGAALFLYLVIEESDKGELYGNPELQKAELASLEAKLKNLENDLQMYNSVVGDLKDAFKQLLGTKASNLGDNVDINKVAVSAQKTKSDRQPDVKKTMATVYKKDAIFAQTRPSMCDIEMDKVYEKLQFDNPDGGVWKQGWNVQYNKYQWTKNKLQVFIVPHSHNDPGWIKTFEKYYQDQTNKILSLIVSKLIQFPKMKFIWAEISYLAMWWVEQSPEVRSNVLKLLEEERLEIVTGGWVMPDEANTHYMAMLEQLLQGHDWCNRNLNGYRPNSGWSIDPFGMSPTMAYLLKRSGLDNMLIQRTHYSVKKTLAQSQNLEFNWRQHWDHNATSDMFCHMMPFYSYDIPHTCGPDPKICCQFDFLRLPGGRASCPWNVPPRRITESNIAERATTLLDQYRKKATLYKSNVVLIPLGDDFRWDGEREWNDQYSNYQKLMEYVNGHPELDATINWGTLTDYFKAVRASSMDQTGSETRMFPTLSGDFFTYADRDDHYWSGYFTSRPLWKSMSRILEYYLRGAEILFSLTWAEMEYIGSDKMDLAKECMKNIVFARQSLGLFQHHDGITGTAKDHVVLDYGQKMLQSIKGLQSVLQQSAQYLLTSNKPLYQPKLKTIFFDLDDTRDESWSIPQKTVINLESASAARVVIFNSHAKSRQELVSLRVSNHNVKVYFMNKVEDDEEGEEEEEDVPVQISPVFEDSGDISNSEYELTFLATTPPLGLQTYMIKQLQVDEDGLEDRNVATVKIMHSKKQPFQIAPFTSVELREPAPFSLSNTYTKATFNSDGLLESIQTLDSGETTPTRLEFVKYGTRRRGEQSGAYLFLPDGVGHAVQLTEPVVRVVEGKLMSYVEIVSAWLRHKVTLHNSPGVDGTSLHLENDVDLTRREMNNWELAMRVSSSLNSGDTSFTDLNGFQMIRRKRYDKLTLQGNWYPVPTITYIQDDTSRLSLMTAQPLGGASLSSGQLEIMMDRRLAQDDNRGLFQGVQDNKVARQKFTLLLERLTAGCNQEPVSQASYPSLTAHAARHTLLHPLFRMIYVPDGYVGSTMHMNYSPVQKPLDCDIHLINLRSMTHNSFDPSGKTALILHRHGFNSCYRPIGLTCQTSGGKVSLDDMFPRLYSTSVNQVSLSLMYEGMKMEKAFTVSIQPMEMYSFILSR